MPPPDFCITGAPKCGTTALHHALGQHPGVFMPEWKEPHFFSDNAFPAYRKYETLDAYISAFNAARPDQMRGEASVYYMTYPHMLDRLLSHNPDVKCIALIRNPVEHFRSLHNHFYKRQFENHEDPQKAWKAQSARACGEDLPPLCPNPDALQYKTLSALGTQLENLYDRVNEDNLLILFYDDFAADPANVYKQVLRFLNLAEYEDVTFPEVNASVRLRSPWVEASLTKNKKIVGYIKRGFKKPLNALGIRPLVVLRKLNQKPDKYPISTEFREKLLRYFEPEIIKIENLTGRDLSCWRTLRER